MRWRFSKPFRPIAGVSATMSRCGLGPTLGRYCERSKVRLTANRSCRRHDTSALGLMIFFIAIYAAPLAQGQQRCGSPEHSAKVRSDNWDPPAIEVCPDQVRDTVQSLVAAGRRLFTTRFNIVDGAGRPAATGDSKPTFRPAIRGQIFTRLSGPDANSCAGCHFQPRIGGAAEFPSNVFQGAHFADVPIVVMSPEFTNERGTPSLFGTGAIELVAREMTRELHGIRTTAIERARSLQRDVTLPLTTKGVNFGAITARADGTLDAIAVEGVDVDLVVRPFGVKGVAVSLREFTNFALNHHHGIQTVERFGWQRTGVLDFDDDGVDDELSLDAVTAMTLFQASLPPPGRADLHSANGGFAAFQRIGCSACHIPALPLDSSEFIEPNPQNRPGSAGPDDFVRPISLRLPVSNKSAVYPENGAIKVAAFTDLKRHRICDQEDPFFCNERLSQDFVPLDVFMTPRLWDVGSTAPYGHRADLTTLSEAIVHHSAEARSAKEQFLSLPDDEKRAVIKFLMSLRIPGNDDENERTPE